MSRFSISLYCVTFFVVRQQREIAPIISGQSLKGEERALLAPIIGGEVHGARRQRRGARPAGGSKRISVWPNIEDGLLM